MGERSFAPIMAIVSRRHALSTLAGTAAMAAIGPVFRAQPRRRQLLLIVDGLRPDYVSADVMPRLHALGTRGVRRMRVVRYLDRACFATPSVPDAQVCR